MATRRTRITARVEHDRGVFMISVAAELAEMHPQTLRMYEARGLIEPKRSPKGTRLYSQADVERLRRIQEMTTEWGMNLAGVERVLRARGAARPHGAQGAASSSAGPSSSRRRSPGWRRSASPVKAEIVRYEAAPGTALIPIRHVKRPGLREQNSSTEGGDGEPAAGIRTVTGKRPTTAPSGPIRDPLRA